MKTIYALLAFGIFVVGFWYAMAMYMVYQVTKDLGAWTFIITWINKWIQWRYGWKN